MLQYFLRQSDENHVVSTENIVGSLQETCGIYAERRSVCRDIEEINKAILIAEEEIDAHEAKERVAEDESENASDSTAIQAVWKSQRKQEKTR